MSWRRVSRRWGRARRRGGGRKKAADLDPGLRSDLLREEGFSLQGNAKTLEDEQHPDRNAQFPYINEQASQHQDTADPVISVDTENNWRRLPPRLAWRSPCATCRRADASGCRVEAVATQDPAHRRRRHLNAELATLPRDPHVPHRGFSSAVRTTRSTTSCGRPCWLRPVRGNVHRRATDSQCHRSSVPGATRKIGQRSRGTTAPTWPTPSDPEGRSAAASPCRRTTIS
jgi:hypothetical protein